MSAETASTARERVPCSVVIAAKDEAAEIAECIASVGWASEVIVVENDSTDDTVGVSRRAGAIVFSHPFTTIGCQRNAAIARARHEWILVVDADERATPQLGEEVRSVIGTSGGDVAFRVRRRNVFLGREIRHGGWERDRPVRLFRSRMRYDERPVHEHVMTDGPVAELREPLVHFPYASLAEYFAKLDRYSRWWAEQSFARGRRTRAWTIALKPPAKFVSMYLLRAGFLDGAAGVIVAALAAMSVAAKYARLWELQRQGLGTDLWGLGTRDWGLGREASSGADVSSSRGASRPSPQSPVPSPESPVPVVGSPVPISLAHKAEFTALRAVVGALGALKWERAGNVGARIGALGYRPLGIRRRVVERQIAAAFPGLSDADVRRIARGAYQHLGRASIETAMLARLEPTAVLDLFEGTDGWSAVESALDLGRGLIFVTGHLGNWELGGAYLAARGVPIDAIARRMSNPLFDRYLTETRSRIGMVVVHDADAVRRTPRSLRENRAVAFLADQGVLGLASTFVPFFGRPAKTPRGPAVFALRLRVPVVFGAAVRQPSGKYRLAFEPVEVRDTGDRDRDVDAIVARYTATLERWVRRYPEQYFWHHRRWRRQPPDTPPELREPS